MSAFPLPLPPFDGSFVAFPVDVANGYSSSPLLRWHVSTNEFGSSPFSKKT